MRKDNRRSFRFCEEEIKALDLCCSILKVNLSEFVRDTLLEKYPKIIPKGLDLEKALKEMRRDQRKCMKIRQQKQNMYDRYTISNGLKSILKVVVANGRLTRSPNMKLVNKVIDEYLDIFNDLSQDIQEDLKTELKIFQDLRKETFLLQHIQFFLSVHNQQMQKNMVTKQG